VHLPHLVQDLAFVLIIAALVTLICKKLKQPVVLGYLIAGFIVSPHFPLTPSVADPEGIRVWADIGVIFLLFGLGLEFSFRKLASVGRSAFITAVMEIAVMLGAGYLLGRALGWKMMDSIFLGGILSISSTTIIVRAFEELGLRKRRFTSLVFGVLIVEDLLAILLLVLLSSVAATQTLSVSEVGGSALKLGFFLVLWYVVGMYALPSFFRRARSLMSDETTLVVAVGLCLSMVVLATKVGFSSALGAFVMGSLLAETRERERIEHLILPVKDLFAAVFFISVGMLIDPQTLITSFWPIFWITLVTVGGKFLGSASGALLSGTSMRHSVQAGFSLAQIGEFSFIIATLGLSLKVTSDFLYPIAVAVSAITTFTTPYLIRLADPASNAIEKSMPIPFKLRLERYRAWLEAPSRGQLFFSVLQETGSKILLNGVMVVAIAIAGEKFLLPWLTSMFPNTEYIDAAVGGLCLLMAAPFFWAIFSSSGLYVIRGAIWQKGRRSLLFIYALGTGIGLALLGFLLSRFFAAYLASGIFLGSVAAYLIFARRFAQPLYQRLEGRFLENLADREDHASPVEKPRLAPWDAKLTEAVISSDSPIGGQPLMNAKLQERFQVMVAVIERGRRQIVAPTGSDMLYPGDRLYLIADKERVEAARAEIESAPEAQPPEESKAFGLDSFLISSSSSFLGRPIRDSGLREALGGLVVGIERAGRRILNPDSSTRLLEQDLLWVVGDLEKIAELKRVPAEHLSNWPT
jgi:CPA2 family monovalent cation:H+ antiporter-2